MRTAVDSSVLLDLFSASSRFGADRLLTRDRGFARRYFPRLAIIDPSRAAR